MYELLIGIIILLCLALIATNIYFRAKVLKAHRQLRRDRVDFRGVHFFDSERMESEVLPRYPQHRETILAFANNMRRSVRTSMLLIVLITLFGAVLMYYR